MPVTERKKIGAAVCAMLATATLAWANSAGVPPGQEIARTGCGCHVSEIRSDETPLTQLFLLGVPEAYEPGATYPLTMLVLGPVNPLFGGFALEVTAGALREVDDATRVHMLTECDLMEADTSCDTTPGGTFNRCWIASEPECPSWDGGAAKGGSCERCAQLHGTEPPETCRVCSQDVLSIEATHSAPTAVPLWEVEWTAPPAGTGPVTIYFAGNSVDGVLGMNDRFDHWNVLEPVEVPEAN